MPAEHRALVVRGRMPDPDADGAATRTLRDRVADTKQPAVRVWTPHRIVAFGRRDTRSDGYDAAAAAASDRGYEPVERSVGGRAVAYDGETTLAFARFTPVDGVRGGLDERYEALTTDVERALESLGVDAERGEPADSFCPGQHSLRAPSGGKLAGLAQRVTSGAAITSGVLVVANHAELAGVLDAVYHALDVPFDPDSVGSVARTGGPSDPRVVREALEDALVGDREREVVDATDL
ncbi:lipoate--protein ligase family protein [Halorubellus sp. JP-L1]|uniref:lipoate--protein ligase family protein n=1 Tax=Halorubellus sp. JP-L1 TaxID=2715753 RepID=UPI00140A3EE5|nr:lipoate--protein ligase family protein [Halorubellus sp. JP-L1]NHN41586.1 lipoate--protein ligase family protein [Halorubellus sp. JP-L1]